MQLKMLYRINVKIQRVKLHFIRMQSELPETKENSGAIT